MAIWRWNPKAGGWTSTAYRVTFKAGDQVADPPQGVEIDVYAGYAPTFTSTTSTAAYRYWGTNEGQPNPVNQVPAASAGVGVLYVIQYEAQQDNGSVGPTSVPYPDLDPLTLAGDMAIGDPYQFGASTYGGCPWPIDSACFTDEWDTFSTAVQSRAIALASSTLERLTGYRVSNCPVTVRPCKAGCSTGSPYVPAYGNTFFNPQINGFGNWVNMCGCTTSCSCSPLCEVVLPGPVGRIDAVKVDGQTIDPAKYRLDNGNTLVWTGAEACPWPICQEMRLPDGEVGTFSVTYLNAFPVDSLGAYAAGILAMEFARACAGNRCNLPTGVTQVVRQGITMEIASGAFPGGLTGLREVDTYLALWNPGQLTRPTTAWSPDVRRPRITTL